MRGALPVDVPTAAVALPFFEAAATIIPILLIALLFQAGTLDVFTTDERHAPTSSERGLIILILFAWIGVGILAGIRTLDVLAKGHGSTGDERFIAVMLMILVAGVCLGPFWAEVRRMEDDRRREGKRNITGALWVTYCCVAAGVCSAVGASVH